MAMQRPQDINRSFRRNQIKVNTGPSAMLPPENYREDLQKSIEERKVALQPVSLEELYTNGSAIHVHDEESFNEMLNQIVKLKVVSVDYEFHTEDSFNGFVSLISLCTWEETYVIDPLYEIWPLMITKFKTEVLENDKILKVFFNMDNDVLLGQTTFGAFMKGVVDLYYMYEEWKRALPTDCFLTMKDAFVMIELKKAKQKKLEAKLDDASIKEKWSALEKPSYEKMVMGVYGKKAIIEKQLRMSDWRVRPLGQLINYAAKDAFYLLGMFYVLLNKIGQNGLTRAMQQSTKELLKSCQLRKHESITKILSTVFVSADQQQKIYRLYEWRLNLAKRIDRNPKTIMSDASLVQLASSSIRNHDEVSTFIKNLANPIPELLKQVTMISAYLLNEENTIRKKEHSICHNCNMEGHLGFECAEEPDPQARAAFLNRQENKDKKQRQRERRDRNYRANLEKRKQ